MRIRKLDVFIIFIAVVLLIFGISTWASFSYIFATMVKQALTFSQKADTDLSYATFQYTNPQMTNYLKFYMFNVTNPDEIKYQSATPCLVEVGPYSVRESEQKKYVDFNEDKTQMYYENYKRYIISNEKNCPDCDWEQPLLFPNSPGLGAVATMIDPKFGITRTGRLIISIGLTLLGEYPFVHHKVREVLFDGYDDPFLSAAHSGFITLISGLVKGNGSIVPIPVPSMQLFGYLQGYNNTKDEEYWVDTGKKNINDLGKVRKWAGLTSLPNDWWPYEEARKIKGSDSGACQQMHVTETSTSDFFFSFMCRSFTKTFYRKETINSVPTIAQHVGYDEWDTTNEKNRIFRYRNIEKRNYYPEWPQCPPKGKCDQSASIDCSKSINFCHACCDGSYYNGTYLLPPGMFPLVCYPGKNQPSPFSIVFSPPHFLYSPQQVRDTVVGMKPDETLHDPMIYNSEPYSGSTVKVINRQQVNMPVIKSHDVPSSQNMPNVIIPLFWQESIPELAPFIYYELWTGFVFVPRLMTTLQFIAIGLSLFLFSFLAFLKFRTYRKRVISTPILSNSFDSSSSVHEDLVNTSDSFGSRRLIRL